MVNDIEVNVVYVTADGELFDVQVSLLEKATVREAIIKSDVLSAYPDMRLENISIGVYSLRKSLEDQLHDKDRVEIYRPLLIDPMVRRRKAVNEKRDPKKWRRER